jgi:cytochrome c biogenesis protein CcmG/thiol:disulfide interchange protein DsbE
VEVNNLANPSRLSVSLATGRDCSRTLRSTMRRPVAIGAAVAIALALGAALLARTRHDARPPAPSAPLARALGVRRRHAPAFAARTMTGQPLSLGSLRGRPAVVNFWASDCPPCRRETAALTRFAGAGAGHYRLLGIDSDRHRSAALAYIRRARWTYPQIFDPNATLTTRFGVLGTPTTLFIDRHGLIVDAIVGPATIDELRSRVAHALRA